METLTDREILVELRRLGIHSLSELRDYLREYKAYWNDSVFSDHLLKSA